MKERFKKLFENKFFKMVLIPVALFMLWFGLTCLYIISFDTSFSIWSYAHPQLDFTSLTFNNLHKGDLIAGHFIAQDNNLGIISIRFKTYIRPPYAYEDKFLFSIKEKGAKNWYCKNTYRSGLIYDVPLFPFGFPQVADSRGKEYEFELLSLNGNNANAVSISDRNPILVSKYKYSRSELLHNKFTFLKFLSKKVYNAMLTPDVWFSSLIYSLPLLFYLFWVSPLKKRLFTPLVKNIDQFIKKSESLLVVPFKLIMFLVYLFKHILTYELEWAVIFVVLFDALIIQITNDLFYIIIILLWMITARSYRLSSKNSFQFVLFLLALSPIFLLLNDGTTAENTSVWAFMFLVAGVIQLFFELRNQKFPLPD